MSVLSETPKCVGYKTYPQYEVLVIPGFLAIKANDKHFPVLFSDFFTPHAGNRNC